MRNLQLPIYQSGRGYSPVLAVTRAVDFATLQAALVSTLTRRVDEAYRPGVPAFVSERLRDDIVLSGATLDDLWPGGEDAPWIWLLVSRSHGDGPRYRLDVEADGVREDSVAFDVLAFDVSVNGIPFDAGRYRTSLARPAAGGALRLRVRYTDAAAVVTQVNP